jgi:hypothetical protein
MRRRTNWHHNVSVSHTYCMAQLYASICCFSLIKMKSNGILQRLRLRWVPQPRQCDTTPRVATGWTDVVPPVTALVGSVVASLSVLTVELMLYKCRCRKVTVPHRTHKTINTINTLHTYPAGNLHKQPTKPNRNVSTIQILIHKSH